MQTNSSQLLNLWRNVSMAMVHDDRPDLTTRQMSVLLTIYLDPPPHTVRGLAQKLGVTKPVITRALDTMGRLDLVHRRRDPEDRRNVIISRTVGGSLFLEHLADQIAESSKEVMA